MSKILCYGFENGRLWFGKVGAWSWFLASVFDGRYIKVKTIKGFESYGYYNKSSLVELSNHNFTNCGVNFNNPFTSIALAEKKSVYELLAMPSFHQLEQYEIFEGVARRKENE